MTSAGEGGHADFGFKCVKCLKRLRRNCNGVAELSGVRTLDSHDTTCESEMTEMLNTSPSLKGDDGVNKI